MFGCNTYVRDASPSWLSPNQLSGSLLYVVLLWSTVITVLSLSVCAMMYASGWLMLDGVRGDAGSCLGPSLLFCVCVCLLLLKGSLSYYISLNREVKAAVSSAAHGLRGAYSC